MPGAPAGSNGGLSFLEGKTRDGVRVIGVEPGLPLHPRADREVLAAVIVQGRGLEADGD